VYVEFVRGLLTLSAHVVSQAACTETNFSAVVLLCSSAVPDDYFLLNVFLCAVIKFRKCNHKSNKFRSKSSSAIVVLEELQTFVRKSIEITYFSSRTFPLVGFY